MTPENDLQRLTEALARQRQTMRDYLAECTTLVWDMQRALGEPCRQLDPQDATLLPDPGSPPGIPVEIIGWVRRLHTLSGVIEAMTHTDSVFRALYDDKLPPDSGMRYPGEAAKDPS